MVKQVIYHVSQPKSHQVLENRYYCDVDYVDRFGKEKSKKVRATKRGGPISKIYRNVQATSAEEARDIQDAMIDNDRNRRRRNQQNRARRVRRTNNRINNMSRVQIAARPPRPNMSREDRERAFRELVRSH